MKSILNFAKNVIFTIGVIYVLTSGLLGCKKTDNTLRVVTSADYPPFAFYKEGALVGFEIDLANALAKELHCAVNIQDLGFGGVLAALHSKTADLGIAGLSPTPEREREFDFTPPYYAPAVAALYSKNTELRTVRDLNHMAIAAQTGSTMAKWAAENAPKGQVWFFDDNIKAVEAIKAGRVKALIVALPQAIVFARENPSLRYKVFQTSGDGCAIALPKNSHLKNAVSAALRALERRGVIKALARNWNLQ